jgi:hypothetical protein
MDYKKWQERAFVFTLVGCVQYVILTVLGMLVYTGGTYTDSNSVGYNFFENYFSDIGRTVSHSGTSNTLGFVLFVVAMTVGGIAIVAFFWATIGQFQEPPLLKAMSIVGSVIGGFAGIAFIVVALVPADIDIGMHRLFMYISFGSILASAFIYTIAMISRDKYRNNYQLTYVLFTAAAALYMLLLFFGPDRESVEGLVIQAAGQKIIVYAMIVNFFIQAYGARLLAKGER